MNILLVEDELFARKAMVKKLSAYNPWDIILEAENGMEALALINDYDVDVLITDVKMPKMNGIELLNAIEDERIQKVILSGYGEFEYAKKSIAHGVKSYLLKPVDYEELINVVEKLRGNYYEMRIMHSLFRNNSGAYDKPLIDGVSDGILAVFHDEDAREAIISEVKSRIENQLKALNYSDVRVLGVLNPYKKNEQIFFIRGCGDAHQLLSRRDAMASLLNEHQFMAATSLPDREKRFGQSYEICRRMLLGRFFTKERIFTDALTDQPSIRLNNIKQKIEYYMDYLYSGDDTDRKRFFLEEIFASAGNIVNFEETYNYFFERLIERKEGVGKWHLTRSLNDFDSLQMLLDYAETICTSSEVPEDDLNIIDKIKDHIEQHYDEDINLKELAENIYYLNPDYLSRKFKETIGISFKKYLLKVRMEKSRFLLKQGDLSVGDVAARVGYNSNSYFIKNYKAFYGYTPKSEK